MARRHSSSVSSGRTASRPVLIISETRTHAGAHDLFYLHFVRTDRLPARLAKLFAGLQKFREQADYARAFHFTDEDAREEVEHAAAICEALGEWLVANGWT